MLTLPDELWEIVIDHVAESTPVDLLACARVCRALHPRAVAKFYESVRVSVTSRSGCDARPPPLLSAAAFRVLLDLRGSALYAIHTLWFHLRGDEVSDCLTGMALPSDHRVTTLCLRGSKIHWPVVSERLRLVENFAGIVSLDLMASVESTSVFAAAVAQFPLLRKLSFDGTIMRHTSRNGLAPPSFAQPCDLTLSGLDPFTWPEVCRWALLDLSRFGGMFVNLQRPELFFSDFLRRHPAICPLIHDMHVSYMGNAQEAWPDLDAGLSSLKKLKVLRLECCSDRSTDEEADAAFAKVADVAKRLARIAPCLRDLHIDAVEDRRYHLEEKSYGSDRMNRLVTELAHLGPPLRVNMNLRWNVFPRLVGPDKQSQDGFFAAFAASCRPRFAVVEWSGYACLSVSTGGYR